MISLQISNMPSCGVFHPSCEILISVSDVFTATFQIQCIPFQITLAYDSGQSSLPGARPTGLFIVSRNDIQRERERERERESACITVSQL